MARMQQSGSAAIRSRKRPANSRTSPHRTFHPLVRRVQHRDFVRGDHAAASCEREDGWVDSGECVERGGGGGFCDVCLDDGAEGGVCW